jgi:hypothetical protein
VRRRDERGEETKEMVAGGGSVKKSRAKVRKAKWKEEVWFSSNAEYIHCKKRDELTPGHAQKDDNSPWNDDERRT